MIRVKYLALLIFCLTLSILTSCKKNETLPPADLNNSYFPLKTNSSVTYQVDSTAYDDFNSSETDFIFQIKDTVISEIESEAGRRTVYIERYKRNTPSDEWRFQKVISRSITGLRAEEFIENRRFVKFIFPPVENKTWNGNTYNNLGEQQYYFKSVNHEQIINNLSFDSTAVVIQIDESNLLQEDYAEEVYAKNVGLVKKQVKSIEKDFYTQKVKRGYQYTMQVISFR